MNLNQTIDSVKTVCHELPVLSSDMKLTQELKYPGKGKSLCKITTEGSMELPVLVLLAAIGIISLCAGMCCAKCLCGKEK